MDSNAHHPAPLRRFVTLVPSINVMTYLLTYDADSVSVILPALRLTVYYVLQSQKVATGYSNNKIHKEAVKIDIKMQSRIYKTIK